MKTMKWLLRRELWEHKGAFFWTPVAVAAALLLLVGGGFMYALAAGGHDTIQFNGHSVVAIQGIPPALRTKLAYAAASGYLGLAAPLFIVLAVVVFFYCLAALHDDRRDRSILFWKSLPLSDTQTVLSKVISALIVAPLVATLAAVATMFGFLLIISIVAVTHGGSATTLIWGPASPVSLSAGLLAAIPVYALWALPTAGWLLLCSAWAKSKPFLWAVMLPLFAGIIVSTTKLMHVFDMTTGWFWQHIVGRLLLGTVPGMDLVYRLSASDQARNVESLAALMSPAEQLKTLAMPDLWIGAAFGVAFIVLAIVLRKRAGEI